jgi:hypothetical protein
VILRIRIRRAIAGVIDGVSLSHLLPGLAYDVSESLGGYLVTCGDAEVAPATAPVVDPADDDTDSAIFGGVIVAPPLDRASDRPPRKRRRARR